MAAVLLNAAIDFVLKNIVPGTIYRYSNFYDASVLLKYNFSTAILSEALKTLVNSGELLTPKKGVYTLPNNMEYPFKKKERKCLEILNEVMTFGGMHSFGDIWSSVDAKEPGFSAGVLSKTIKRLVDTNQIDRVRHGYYNRKSINKFT
jgi:DNA-binding HxlR family transcriptional regulator